MSPTLQLLSGLLARLVLLYEAWQHVALTSLLQHQQNKSDSRVISWYRFSNPSFRPSTQVVSSATPSNSHCIYNSGPSRKSADRYLAECRASHESSLWRADETDIEVAYPSRMADQETRRQWWATHLAFIVIIPVCYSFNLDPRFSVIKRGSQDDYFGYAVTEHQIVNGDRVSDNL